jgi:photosystem II stability/assembly factor-like uncharacterized protein
VNYERVVAVLALACACARAPRYGPGDDGEQWMRSLRAYPSGVIPADARHDALRAAASTPLAPAPDFIWRTRGPQPCGVRWPFGFQTGRIFPVAVSPADPSLILVGSASGGIWRSTDGGANFAPVTDDQADLSIATIAFAPGDPSIVYAGMGSDFLGTGMLKSVDAGRHWTRLQSLSAPNLVRKIVVDPTDANHLWVSQGGVQEDDGSIGSGGLLVSFDGGATFRATFHGRPDALVMRPGDPTTLYMTARAADDPGQTPGAFRSTDGGLTWKSIYVGPYAPDKFPILRLEIARSDPSVLYIDWWATVGDAPTMRLLRSNDGGDTWTEVATKNLTSERPSYLAVDPRDPQTLYLGLRDLYKSTDGGATWTNLTRRYAGTNGAFSPAGSAAHEDQRGFAFSADGKTYYAANDGGLFRSNDGGQTFQALGASLSISQLYAVAAHPTKPNSVFAATQDDGLQLSDDGTARFREIGTGDFGSVVFDIADPSRFVSNYIGAQIYRFTNGGSSVVRITTEATFGEALSGGRVSFIAPLVGQRRSGKVYFATWRLFVSSDFGTTWTPVAGTTDLTKGGTDTVTTVAVSESDDTIYTGSAQGAVMVSRNAGATWTDVTAGLPDRAIAALAIDRRDSSIAYAGLSGYRSSHIFKTTDAGATWNDLSAGLPDMPVNAIYIDRGNPSALYAGTDLGVYRFDAAAKRWTSFNNGLPPVVAMSFDTTADGHLLVGTYGRGIYELAPLPLARRRAVGR